MKKVYKILVVAICGLTFLKIVFSLIEHDVTLDIARTLHKAQGVAGRIVYFHKTLAEAKEELSKGDFDQVRTRTHPDGFVQLTFRLKTDHPLNWMNFHVYGGLRFENDRAVASYVEVMGAPL